MVPKLIGISGKLRSGKDTLAAQLERIFNHDYQIAFSVVALADPLRRCVAALTGCQPQDLLSQAFKASPSAIANPTGGFYTYRQLLQWMGDSLRVLNPDSVVDALWASLQPQGHDIISDVRTLNEVMAIKKRGGMVIRVERPGLAAWDRHATEIALDGYAGFDHLLVNDSTPVALEEKARLWLSGLTNDSASVDPH
jgi:hypothetical protein